MKKTISWIGVAVLVVGIVVFNYAYMTIQNINATYIKSSYQFTIDPEFKVIIDPERQQRWDLAQMLQPVGLGLLTLGAIMLLYGVFVKK